MDIMWVEPLRVCWLSAQGWNTSQVTMMFRMFDEAEAFNGDVSVLAVCEAAGGGNEKIVRIVGAIVIRG